MVEPMHNGIGDHIIFHYQIKLHWSSLLLHLLGYDIDCRLMCVRWHAHTLYPQHNLDNKEDDNKTWKPLNYKTV